MTGMFSVDQSYQDSSVFLFYLLSLPFFQYFLFYFFKMSRQSCLLFYLVYTFCCVIPREFFTSASADGLSLEFEVFRTFLSILADFNNAVVWVVFTRLLISKSSSPCINPLLTVPRAPVAIRIIVTFTFFSHSFNFTLWLAGTAKSTILQVLFFLFFVVDYHKVWLSGRD